jgi:hypothetical protein
MSLSRRPRGVPGKRSAKPFKRKGIILRILCGPARQRRLAMNGTGGGSVKRCVEIKNTLRTSKPDVRLQMLAAH